MVLDGERQRHRFPLLRSRDTALPVPALEDHIRNEQNQPHRVQVSGAYSLKCTVNTVDNNAYISRSGLQVTCSFFYFSKFDHGKHFEMNLLTIYGLCARLISFQFTPKRKKNRAAFKKAHIIKKVQ